MVKLLAAASSAGFFQLGRSVHQTTPSVLVLKDGVTKNDCDRLWGTWNATEQESKTDAVWSGRGDGSHCPTMAWTGTEVPMNFRVTCLDQGVWLQVFDNEACTVEDEMAPSASGYPMTLKFVNYDRAICHEVTPGRVMRISGCEGVWSFWDAHNDHQGLPFPDDGKFWNNPYEAVAEHASNNGFSHSSDPR